MAMRNEQSYNSLTGSTAIADVQTPVRKGPKSTCVNRPPLYSSHIADHRSLGFEVLLKFEARFQNRASMICSVGLQLQARGVPAACTVHHICGCVQQPSRTREAVL